MPPTHGGMPGWILRVLCLLGRHDFRLIEVQAGFGPGGTVEKVACRSYGYVKTRRR